MISAAVQLAGYTFGVDSQTLLSGCVKDQLCCVCYHLILGSCLASDESHEHGITDNRTCHLISYAVFPNDLLDAQDAFASRDGLNCRRWRLCLEAATPVLQQLSERLDSSRNHSALVVPFCACAVISHHNPPSSLELPPDKVGHIAPVQA